MARNDWLIGGDRRSEAAERIYAAATDLVSRTGFENFSIEALAAVRVAVDGDQHLRRDLGEPVDRAGFQKNDRGKANARHAGQQTVLRTRLDAFLQTLFKKLDL